MKFLRNLYRHEMTWRRLRRQKAGAEWEFLYEEAKSDRWYNKEAQA